LLCLQEHSYWCFVAYIAVGGNDHSGTPSFRRDELKF
jgi:hypothetical protein